MDGISGDEDDASVQQPEAHKSLTYHATDVEGARHDVDAIARAARNHRLLLRRAAARNDGLISSCFISWAQFVSAERRRKLTKAVKEMQVHSIVFLLTA